MTEHKTTCMCAACLPRSREADTFGDVYSEGYKAGRKQALTELRQLMQSSPLERALCEDLIARLGAP
jgi:hypothetical protein